ncbi:MAG: family 78 glycoside hydrolase catalytic domain [Eubacteriales bacterium]|nr:family 78 glycoside hydrolase catalytic domain [Candidatus Colimorpha enterica]
MMNGSTLWFPDRFIAAGHDYTTLEKAVPAPYFRRCFVLSTKADEADLLICGLGFYELYVNGTRVTKGLLAPYITNPDHILYYDRYDLTPYLVVGENVLGICLGNGLINNPFGNIWDFEKADFRGVPRFAMSLDITASNGESLHIESDETFVCASSPIVFDDYRAGEHYDARLARDGWNTRGYDDRDWTAAVAVPSPKGEKRLCEAEPIVVEKELRPISVVPCQQGYLYDFGEDNTGVCRLTVDGVRGQEIALHHVEYLKDGIPHPDFLLFEPWKPYRDVIHTDRYICQGGRETYQPLFTYHGFRYVYVEGFTEEQASEDALTFVVFHTRLKERGQFSCGDPIANSLQDMVRRSTVSNFHHFPTDCPHREKNGWTADAKLSAEQTLLNFEPDRNYREWMRSIVRAQNNKGALPGIVPTGGWGFAWGNGPAWDGVLTEIPYLMYRYRGDLSVAEESSEAFVRYLRYLKTRIGEDGLIAIGLGDWCQVGRPGGSFVAPLALTDTLLSMDIAYKASVLFAALKQEDNRNEADELYRQLRCAARAKLLDPVTKLALGNCQTSQAMGLAYGLFEEDEKQKAFAHLLRLIDERDGHMDVGVLGMRVIFDILADFGYADLAYHMITRTDYPAYGEWVARGETTLREMFTPEPQDSLNHHFWGDISRFFIERVVGIRYYHGAFADRIVIAPHFIGSLPYAEAWHDSPDGHISCRWERGQNGISLTVSCPSQRKAVIRLPRGYVFADTNESERSILNGGMTVCVVCE